MDCYSPYPIEEAAEAMGFDEPKEKGVSRVCLLGGILGGLAMFTLETWISVWAYPLNVAGRGNVLLDGVHHSCLRVDHSMGRTLRRFRHAGARIGCLRPIIQFSMRRTFATAQPQTNFFSALRPTIPGFPSRIRDLCWNRSTQFPSSRWTIKPMLCIRPIRLFRWTLAAAALAVLIPALRLPAGHAG